MIRERGPPSLFLTLSCAEYESTEIITYLHKVNNVPEKYPIGKLCTEDPISVTRKFEQKFNDFLNIVILKGEVLGKVAHYFVKKEYQARGAPHYHLLLWIDGAPVIGRNSHIDVLKWIEQRITCRIPDEKTNPELHQLVVKYQSHKCSNYCKKKKKVKGTFITKCKFGFPRAETEEGVINSAEESLKSKAKVYHLPRSSTEVKINDYNPIILLIWKANMDIQYIADSTLAIAHYMTGYVAKAHMQETFADLTDHHSLYSKLWSFGVRSLHHRECGLYEAADLLLGNHLCSKFESVEWISAERPSKRKRRIKKFNELKNLAQAAPDSTDLYESDLVDTFYPQRPNELE